ncbi:cytochrome c biogenesis protein ResB [Spongisporangium articulatum]|uniref:Cytochrome c biogenesis protein ResB n=1 Tax=Spongisporangium articulatum TaxID=3362603 RepID=A0ABW8ANM6_9ACTN
MAITDDTSSTAPPDEPEEPGPEGRKGTSEAPVLPKLGVLGTLRFVWRQLTSMRVALMLLMLLAVAAVPGSIFPQNRINPSSVTSYLLDHPTVGPTLRKLGMFDVYNSPWFSAIYLLLFISLIGCVLPRSRQHWQAMRQGPTIVPRRLARLPEHRELTLDDDVLAGRTAEQVLAAARNRLRRKGYRTRVTDGDPLALSAERGYLAETGNLVFHLALLGLLAAIAAGSFLAYSGQVIVVEGQSFSNTLVDYDSFTGGRRVDQDDLPPFSFTLNSLKVRFEEAVGGNQFGAARDFEASVDYRRDVDAPQESKVIRLNDPLDVDGARVFLVGNGYAPVITVKDGEGNVVQSDATGTPFLPVDGVYTSNGVIKAADAKPKGIGLIGVLLPTEAQNEIGQPVSVFPDAKNPRLIFTAYTGDLNMDGGTPQNVYSLDTSKMTQLKTKDGGVFSVMVKPGDTVTLPDGAGTVTFDGLKRYAAFDVRHDPTKEWVLVFAVAALVGLTLSLFVRRRRVWVRVEAQEGTSTVVQVAGLARSDGDRGLGAEVDGVLAALEQRKASR